MSFWITAPILIGLSIGTVYALIRAFVLYLEFRIAREQNRGNR